MIIKIEFNDDIAPMTAMEAVRRVMDKGLVSANRHGAYYRSLTTFNNGLEIYAGRSPTMCTFRCYIHKQEDE